MKEESRKRGSDEGPTELDFELAEEIARFIANRAFLFEDHEARAWALTDFEVWAKLAGSDAELTLAPRPEEEPGPDS